MSFRYPQPTNEDDFERFCLRLLRHLWACPGLPQYGRRGDSRVGAAFRVALWTWDEIEQRLSELDDATLDRVLREDTPRPSAGSSRAC